MILFKQETTKKLKFQHVFFPIHDLNMQVTPFCKVIYKEVVLYVFSGFTWYFIWNYFVFSLTASYHYTSSNFTCANFIGWWRSIHRNPQENYFVEVIRTYVSLRLCSCFNDSYRHVFPCQHLIMHTEESLNFICVDNIYLLAERKYW